METKAPSPQTIRFGDFELDARAGELRKKDLHILLGERPLRVLQALVEHPGNVVTREELRRAIWPGETFVDFEDGLNHAVNRLRKVLGDSADHPRFIETLPRHGYRFITPVEALIPPIGTVRKRFLRSRWLMGPAGMILAFLGRAWLNIAGLRGRLMRVVRASRRSPPKIRSIAVLPLENLSHDPEQDYLADGMTEALITNLGKINSLNVISRTTVMHYKGAKKTLPEIARELDVDAVVEGTVLRSGSRVRVTANLLHAPTDRHLWAESYERDLRDVLALQGEVARAIAEEVRVKLTPKEEAHLTLNRPIDPEAFEAYLKGSYAITRIGGRPVTGIEFFRQAIAKDPSYSQAYVGLCLAYIQMGFGHGPLPPKQAFGQIEQAALEAMKLDATLAEAHSCLAWVKAFGGWDWAGCERRFRRAVELSPNSVQAHRLYSWYLSAMQRHEEAFAESQRALKLDPASLSVGYTAAASYWWARQYERCASDSEKLGQMDPTYPGAQHLRGAVYLQAGPYDEAIRCFQRAITSSGEDLPVWFVAHLGCAYSKAGWKAEALEVVDTLQSASSCRYVSPYAIAYLHCSLGDKDKAFQWLEKAYQERNSMLAFLKVDPLFDPLRSDSRFQDLVRRMNFPP